MEQNTESKLEFKDKLTYFYNHYKLKIYIFISVLIAAIIFGTFLFYKNVKKNIFISEKYIEAGLHLSSDNKNDAIVLYEEIIFSKNKFYSVLALNNILENNLEEDSQEILKLFKTLEKINISKEQKNLVKLKKALYLKKISKNVEGNKLLKEIIADNSIWKNTAIELAK